MTSSERGAEYAVRIMAAPLVAVVVAAIMAFVLHLLLMPLPSSLFDFPAIYYTSAALDFLARGFAFVFGGSFVLPARWRAGGALVFVVLGVCLQIHLLSYNSDPEPPRWPLFVATAGGLLAVAVQYIRRPRNES